MAIHNASFLQSGSYGASDFRLPSSSLIAQNGVVGTSDMQVTAPSSGLSVNIATGQAWVQGTQSPFQGSYYVYNDATYSLPIGAANASNPRIDLIGIQIIDAAYGGGTSSTAFVDIQGVPAPTPSAPSAPANFLTLAQVTVPAGATSIISGDIADKRFQFLTSLASGVYQPILRVQQNAPQPIANATVTPLGNVTVQEDNYSGYNAASGSYTVPTAGLYLCVAQVEWNNNNLAYYQTAFNYNAAQAMATGIGINPSASSAGALMVLNTQFIRANTGDTLTPTIYQNAGGSVYTVAGNTFCHIAKVAD